ncbi:hypothetical protein [Tianweitania sediminis]|uniref:Uncharacterized protein n=1 Tax=Tianweitania sediminis TaxID=1502156 RepID=A0A8J7RMK7_9HYPH|nr:hypothetical protein [Tianweitania sediminis]MBP0439896.1 hypothetical protein [Tianweitania sediminis]
MNGIVTHNRGQGAQAFEAAYSAARALRTAAIDDHRREKRRPKDRKRRVMPEGLTAAEEHAWRQKEALRIENASFFAEDSRFQAGLIRERLEDGFRMRSGRVVCGRWREGVHEKGLRSNSLGLPGKMFVAACRRGGNLRMSWDKANLGYESRSKLLSLDAPYYEANKEFLGFWRIDVDGTWPDIYAFRDDVYQLVGSRIPFAPHLVAGDELPDGRFVKPHLIFFLPYGQAVWNKPEDPRCNMRTVKFFEAVYYGIVDALESLGADPGAPATTQRGKSPLSPMFESFSMNDREFMSLSEWAEWVDTSLNREALVRQHAAEHAGTEVKTSNELFTAVQREAYGLLRKWYFESDLRIRGRTEGGLADELHEALEPVAQEIAAGLGGSLSEKQVTLLVSKVASYAAGAFDPARLEKKDVVRKTLLHVVDGIGSVRERQQVAAAYASKERSDKTLARLVGAWDTLAVEASEVSKSALAREAGVSRPTVYARWADLQSVLEGRKGCKVRCIDKKPVATPAGTILVRATVQNPAPELNGPAGRLHAPAVSCLTSARLPESESFTKADASAVERIATPGTAAFLRNGRAPSSCAEIVLPPSACLPGAGAADMDPPWQDSCEDEDADERDELSEQERFLSSDFDGAPPWDGHDVDPWIDAPSVGGGWLQ